MISIRCASTSSKTVPASRRVRAHARRPPCRSRCRQIIWLADPRGLEQVLLEQVVGAVPFEALIGPAGRRPAFLERRSRCAKRVSLVLVSDPNSSVNSLALQCLHSCSSLAALRGAAAIGLAAAGRDRRLAPRRPARARTLRRASRAHRGCCSGLSPSSRGRSRCLK